MFCAIFLLQVYTEALQDVDRESVENYLLQRWGLAEISPPACVADFGPPETGYCAESDPDARKESPDATNLEVSFSLAINL